MLINASPITEAAIAGYHAEYVQDKTKQAMTFALSKTNLNEFGFDPVKAGLVQAMFSLEIKTMPVTAQKASGRCWIFAGLNILREKVAAKLNLEFFELSENFLAFYDKMEKINFFLESMLELSDRDVDDRTVTHLLSVGLNDGGQWDMLVSLIEKYGLVPKYAMQETFQSSNTGHMNYFCNMRLRQYAAQLRDMGRAGASSDELAACKDAQMNEMYGFLAACFGTPPTEFTFEYADKDNAYHNDGKMTPKQFYSRYIGDDLSQYVSLIHAPTGDKPFGRTFTVNYLGNVIGGREVRYLNLPMEELTAYTMSQLKAGELVWFGSDVSKCGDRKIGLWDTESFNLSAVLSMNFKTTKQNQLDYRDSVMNHAMVFTGVNLPHGTTPDRWKIQNSWGDEPGVKGYFVCSQAWFEQYVYQVVIHRKYLSKEHLELLTQAPIVLDPWDPMGSLADKEYTL